MHAARAGTLATITVTFHPDPEMIARQLASLPPGCVKVLVDNGSSCTEVRSLSQAVEGIEGVHLVRLGSNLGLAAAVNRGIEFLVAHCPTEWVLLLDQDSEPEEGAVLRLLTAAIECLDGGRILGAVGPSLRDPGSEALHGFHVLDGWAYRRIHPPADQSCVECIGLNGSGTLAPLQVFCGGGALREDFFIDHVDTEWCFRLRSRGGRFFGVPHAIFRHRMGETFQRIWLMGWRIWPRRSPKRLRYLSRNTWLLLRMAHIPVAWKIWACGKLVLTATLSLLMGPQRIKSFGAVLAGVGDGLLGRGGQILER